MNTHEQTKTAVSFLQLCAAGEVDEAYDKFIAPSFRHHNPWFRGDAASLKEGMRESAATHPDKVFEVLRTITDGELVAVHSRLRLGAMTMAVVHIIRFEGDRIAEMWDIGQAQPELVVNEQGMF
jgi:predicted SnoaL-like aldol condensation-catalyzing enzyme